MDTTSKILILGSIPGKKSLEENQYYAHPQNKFWNIISDLLSEPYNTDYQQRIVWLKKHHIALWDIIESCERKGSLDATIKNESVQNISTLLEDYPNIKAVFCNGKKAFNTTTKILGKNYILPIFYLPSTSPLHTMPYEEKLSQWREILKYL